MRRRRHKDSTLTVIYWRDIPAQVMGRAGRARVSEKLDNRFQVAVDGAATRAGKTGADDYLEEWREETEPCGEDLEREVRDRISELQEQFTPEMLRQMVRNGGWAP